MKVKMSEVSIEALRQAFLDPDSRIRLNSDAPPEPRAEFLALSWEGGFLDGTSIHFNPNLNVLVGGRGTGKSTLECQHGSGDSVRERLRRVDDPTDVLGGRAGRPRSCWRDRRLAVARRRDRGQTLGAVVNWVLGRYAATWRTRLTSLDEAKFERASRWFNRWGIWSLLLSWLPVVGDPMTLLAGMLRTAFVPFVLLVLVGKAARYLFVLLIVT